MEQKIEFEIINLKGNLKQIFFIFLASGNKNGDSHHILEKVRNLSVKVSL